MESWEEKQVKTRDWNKSYIEKSFVYIFKISLEILVNLKHCF